MEFTETITQPSRKSSRGSGNRAKAAVPLTSRVALEVSSPERRHLTRT
jgi:hypothetical protein